VSYDPSENILKCWFAAQEKNIFCGFFVETIFSGFFDEVKVQKNKNLL